MSSVWNQLLKFQSISDADYVKKYPLLTMTLLVLRNTAGHISILCVLHAQLWQP